jgi:serpin B
MQPKGFRVLATIAPLLAAGLCPANALAAADVYALTAAYNASGQALFQVLAREPGNIVLSPYSIGAAMAMTRAGARGETERQMTMVLKHTLAREDADAASAALLTILNDYGKSAEAPARLSTANALMLAKRGDLIGQGYRALVAGKYAAAVHEGATLDDINGWVKERTEGKIDRILDKLPDDTAAVLLNAVYLKAAWASIFSKEATRDDDFKLTAETTVRVTTMHQQANFRITEGAGHRAIRLNYAAGTLGMVVVLPNAVDGLDAVARTLDAGALKALLTTLASGKRSLVALALPRFKAAYKTSLAKVLQLAGMTLAFKDRADFSGMTGKSAGQAGVKIGDVLHRAALDVSEEGTEGSAATAVAMLEARATPLKQDPPTPIPFTVDRPFLFYVVDDTSGAILFQGRVADPRS